MKTRILAGITQANELYFLEVEPKSESHNYFAMSGFTVEPILLERAHEEVVDGLKDGDLWRDAVSAGRTELGLSDWVEHVLDTDGNLTGFDNSLFPHAVTVDGEEYIFRSAACGQHTENVLKHYFINEIAFSKLLSIWEKYNMKDIETKDVVDRAGDDSLETMLANIGEQDIKALAKEAVIKINECAI